MAVNKVTGDTRGNGGKSKGKMNVVSGSSSKTSLGSGKSKLGGKSGGGKSC